MYRCWYPDRRPRRLRTHSCAASALVALSQDAEAASILVRMQNERECRADSDSDATISQPPSPAPEADKSTRSNRHDSLIEQHPPASDTASSSPSSTYAQYDNSPSPPYLTRLEAALIYVAHLRGNLEWCTWELYRDIQMDPGSEQHRLVFWRWDKYVHVLRDLKRDKGLVEDAWRFLEHPDRVLDTLRPTHLQRLRAQIGRGRSDARKCLGIRDEPEVQGLANEKVRGKREKAIPKVRAMVKGKAMVREAPQRVRRTVTRPRRSRD